MYNLQTRLLPNFNINNHFHESCLTVEASGQKSLFQLYFIFIKVTIKADNIKIKIYTVENFNENGLR